MNFDKRFSKYFSIKSKQKGEREKKTFCCKIKIRYALRFCSFFSSCNFDETISKKWIMSLQKCQVTKILIKAGMAKSIKSYV